MNITFETLSLKSLKQELVGSIVLNGGIGNGNGSVTWLRISQYWTFSADILVNIGIGPIGGLKSQYVVTNI